MNNAQAKLDALQAWLKTQQLDAVLIPHEDEFLGEDLPVHNRRLTWLTDFTGSAGAAVVTQNGAAMFVDGRYTVQVRAQVSDRYEYLDLISQPPAKWISEQPSLKRIGFFPKVHSFQWYQKALDTLTNTQVLVELDAHPIDGLWHDRPAAKMSKGFYMSNENAGATSAEKRLKIGQEIKLAGADALVVTASDAVAWLLNLRGRDVPCLPVILAYAVINASGELTLFVDESRLPTDYRQHFGPGVNALPPSELDSFLGKMAGKKVIVDPQGSAAWFILKLESSKATVIKKADPCTLIKAKKNAAEAQGMRDCHIRDGAAVSQFLHWVDTEVAAGRYPNEAQLADKLFAFRQLDKSLIDISFQSISAAGANAAMPHYRHTNKPQPDSLTPNSLYLIDSGGQYPDGTTDITRTIAIGKPTLEMKQQFTRVLRGHIELNRVKFPKGVTGSHIDVLARMYLWRDGYDYDHGTGHGVGHCLNVHEGPQRIARVQNSVFLEPGMVLSNEPGFYKPGHFGIRIENLELVVEKSAEGDRPMFGFEHLTMCPIDVRCIERSMISADDIEWLNEYHAKVWNSVSPLLKGDALQWLKNATQAI